MEQNGLDSLTLMNHPHHLKLKDFLQELFVEPEPAQFGKEIARFIVKNPLVISEFPLLKGTYTRTILYRNKNDFEVMVARWSNGAVSSIHGHPSFTSYCVSEGRLKIDNFKRYKDRVEKTNSGIMSSKEFFTIIGKEGTFDNNIHQVRAIEETLSIHISSDDSRKGEVFSQIK